MRVSVLENLCVCVMFTPQTLYMRLWYGRYLWVSACVSACVCVCVCVCVNVYLSYFSCSGSRGVGNRIGEHFIALAKKDMKGLLGTLPDSNLAYAFMSQKSTNGMRHVFFTLNFSCALFSLLPVQLKCVFPRGKSHFIFRVFPSGMKMKMKMKRTLREKFTYLYFLLICFRVLIFLAMFKFNLININIKLPFFSDIFYTFAHTVTYLKAACTLTSTYMRWSGRRNSRNGTVI